MLPVYVWLLLLASSASGSIAGNDDTPRLLRVTDIDFENTKVEKVCLLAQIDANISLTHTENGVITSHDNSAIPQDLKTDGSFCNKDYVSLLRLSFSGSEVELVFRRNQLKASDLKKLLSYCDDCNYGQWKLEKLNIALLYNEKIYQGNATQEQLKEHISWLTEGVNIKRSFKCDKNDTIITIPIDINKVWNASDGHSVRSEGWKATIKFSMLRLQPFLVFHRGTNAESAFYDPYLCRDLALGHILIILVPLVWFALFIAFHHLKARHGWQPDFNSLRKKRQRSDSATKVDMEETTDVLSDEFAGLELEIKPTIYSNESVA